MSRRRPKGDPIGVAEIALELDVKPRTVHQWQFRALLPDPDYTVNGLPAWERSTIQEWAASTGRTTEPEQERAAV
jgi:hypothetical protein